MCSYVRVCVCCMYVFVWVQMYVNAHGEQSWKLTLFLWPPGTHEVDQAGRNSQRSTRVCLMSTGIKDVCQHAQCVHFTC